MANNGVVVAYWCVLVDQIFKPSVVAFLAARERGIQGAALATLILSALVDGSSSSSGETAAVAVAVVVVKW